MKLFAPFARGQAGSFYFEAAQEIFLGGLFYGRRSLYM
jgi:hypothetical protein